MKQDRALLEQNLIKPTLEIKRRRGVVKDIKGYLSENYSVFEGLVQSWINNPSLELPSIDTRLLYLFAQQIYQKTGDQNINPELFFTENERKTSLQYNGKLQIEEDVEFPLKFSPAIEIDKDTWNTKIHIKLLVALLRSRVLNWNPDAQREATYKVINGEVIEEATLYMENVNEMKTLLKQNKLEKTQVTLNVALNTADNDKDDVEYHSDTYTLLINSGVKIDVTDGYHRIVASNLALLENPDLDFTWELKITNMTVDRAARYLSQVSKRTPISETKRKSMGKETYTDMIIDELRKSKLGDRISKKEMISTLRKEIVTYNTLSYAINKYFKVERKVDMYDVSEYLIEMFDVLLEIYEEEFTTNYSETKKESLINDNNMFIGFISLASRLRENGIEARNVRKYVRNIDFSRSNHLWKKYGILDDKGRLTKNPRVGIEEIFSKIEI